jgi:CHAT domain-containing protein/tetratricopeptide (TPR) repeat protein
MNRAQLRLVGLLLVALIIISVLAPALAHAAPPAQGEDRKAQADALFDEGKALYEAGEYEAALEKLQAALEIYHDIGERKGEAKTLSHIGAAYQYLSQLQEALNYYQEGLAICREVGKRAWEADSIYNIGSIYRNLGEYQKALKYYQEALTIDRELGNRAGEGWTLRSIGEVYEGLGQYQEALKHHEESLAISREIGDRAGEGLALLGIARVYQYLGQYQEALKYYEESLAIFRETGNRIWEGYSLGSIGTIQRTLGQYQEALKYHHETLAIFREMGSRVGEGDTLNRIGRIYGNLGQHQEALKYHEESLAIFRETGYRRREGTALATIGFAYGNLGQHQEALKYFEESLAISREIGNQTGEGSALDSIGQAYRNLGQYQKALKYCEEGLGIRREIDSRAGEGYSLNSIGGIYGDLGQHQEALKYYEESLAIKHELGDREGEASTLGNIGEVYYDTGEKEKALEFYLEALALYEEIRGEATVEELKTTYAETYKDVYERTVALLMELNQPQEAFHYSERARARTLLDQLGNAHIYPRQSDDPALVEQEETLRRAIGALEKSLREEQSKPQAELNDEKINNLTAQLEEKRAELAKLWETLKLKNPEYASLVTVDPLPLAEIQKLLGDATLVEYFVTEEQTFAFVVGQDDFQVETIEVEREELQKALKSFHLFPVPEGVPKEMQRLYDTLFAPVRPHIKTDLLIIAPHDLLHYLPFQALHDGEHYLIEEYTISYIPSASVLPFALEKRKDKAETMLALGNPKVEGAPLLTYAEREAQEVAELYGTTAYARSEATESLYHDETGQAGLIHLACHGEYNPHAPLFSQLLLAADEQHDGYLNVQELYNVELPQADLVTLSACETDVGQVSEGDEVIGLSRALIYAGAPSIVASLWTVDDAATGELMVSFYEHLKGGLSKAEALRAAQIEMIAEEEHNHPFYWAAFGVTGDPGKTSGYQPPARETATLLPSAEATIAPVGATPAPAKGGGGPCPVGALILALGVGVVVLKRHR